MKLKILVQELRVDYTDRDNPIEHYEPTLDITTDSLKVAAGTLRALADAINPPKDIHREY